MNLNDKDNNYEINNISRIQVPISKYTIKILIGLTLVFLLGIAIFENSKGKDYKITLENTYQNSYREVEDAVESIEDNFSRLNVLNGLKDKLTTFINIYNLSSRAKENLDVLPYSHTSIANVSKYLSQVNDYSYSIISKGINGYELSEADNKIIDNFARYGSTLKNNMTQIRNDIEDGNNIEWDKINSDIVDEKIATSAYGSMSKITDDFSEYKDVTYDGPFSDHIEKLEPEYIKNMKEISKEDARDIARKIIDDSKVKSIKFVSEIIGDDGNTIPVYRFEVTLLDNDESSIMIDISKKGGVPLWMLNYKESTIKVLQNKATRDKTEKVARDYIKKIGFENMEVSYVESSDRFVTYNFNYKINDIIVYADLIKVKVSLEDCSIKGFETLGYVMMHKERNFVNPKISIEEAVKVCSTNFKVESINKALIPLSSMKEVLTYEIVGKIGQKEYAVYVNTMTGTVEKMVEIIKQNDDVFERK